MPTDAMTRSDIVVEPIRADNRSDWEALWQGYLAFYESSQPAEDTEVTWTRLHDRSEKMFALGAYDGEELLGIAHYLFHRSFWTAADHCYLQDLFVARDARGHGIGRALIDAVADQALEAGANRLYWLTREDNHAARALYDKVAGWSGFIQYRRSL